MAKVKSFGASYGLSFEVNGSWHKFGAEIEIELEKDDDTDKVKELAWNTVVSEVSKKAREVL